MPIEVGDQGATNNLIQEFLGKLPENFESSKKKTETTKFIEKLVKSSSKTNVTDEQLYTLVSIATDNFSRIELATDLLSSLIKRFPRFELEIAKLYNTEEKPELARKVQVPIFLTTLFEKTRTLAGLINRDVLESLIKNNGFIKDKLTILFNSLLKYLSEKSGLEEKVLLKLESTEINARFVKPYALNKAPIGKLLLFAVGNWYQADIEKTKAQGKAEFNAVRNLSAVLKKIILEDKARATAERLKAAEARNIALSKRLTAELDASKVFVRPAAHKQTPSKSENKLLQPVDRQTSQQSDASITQGSDEDINYLNSIDVSSDTDSAPETTASSEEDEEDYRSGDEQTIDPSTDQSYLTSILRTPPDALKKTGETGAKNNAQINLITTAAAYAGLLGTPDSANKPKNLLDTPGSAHKTNGNMLDTPSSTKKTAAAPYSVLDTPDSANKTGHDLEPKNFDSPIGGMPVKNILGSFNAVADPENTTTNTSTTLLNPPTPL